MVGKFPTVDIIAFIRDDDCGATQRVMDALNELLPVNDWYSSAGNLYNTGPLGDQRLPVLLYAIKQSSLYCHYILIFDEDQAVEQYRKTGGVFFDLFIPYIEALKSIDGIDAIGIGFEAPPPSSFNKDDLKEAGIATLIHFNQSTNSWERNNILPFIGHYL